MKKQIDGERLIQAIREMMQDTTTEGASLTKQAGGGQSAIPPAPKLNLPPHIVMDAKPFEDVLEDPAAGPSSPKIRASQLERIYRMFVRRLLDELPSDPVFVHLLATRPEIEIEIAPRRVSIDGSSVRGRLARLVADGFFNSPKRQGEARSELARTGAQTDGGTISKLFGEFVKDGILQRRGSDQYERAPGVKITTKTIEAT